MEMTGGRRVWWNTHVVCMALETELTGQALSRITSLETDILPPGPSP